MNFSTPQLHCTHHKPPPHGAKHPILHLTHIAANGPKTQVSIRPCHHLYSLQELRHHLAPDQQQRAEHSLTNSVLIKSSILCLLQSSKMLTGHCWSSCTLHFEERA